MRKISQSQSGIFNPRALATLALCAIGGFLALVTFATTPASGTLSDSNTTVTYTGGPFTVPTNATDSAAGPVTCDAADPCDDFPLTINISAAYKTAHPDHVVKIEISWSDPTAQQDLDAGLVDTATPNAPYAFHATNAGDNPETMTIPIASLPTGAHDYLLRVVPFVSTGQTYNGKVTLGASGASGTPTPTPTPPATTAPRYYNYSPGAGHGESSGEPSIGYNLVTHHAMFLAGLETFQVTMPEAISPGGSIPAACNADWLDKSYVLTSTRSADPILFTDQVIGRTFVSQLNTVTQTNPVLIGLNSLMAYTDDDGGTWTPAQVNPPDGSNDHQTVGTGPYPAALSSLANNVNKGRAVYYCGQAGYVLAITGSAYCSRSDDGGLNFGKSVIAYTDSVSGCAQSIHGHVKVGPDGTVYLPNSSCGNQPAVAVSTDAGTTWTVKQVPGGIPTPAVLDPSVAIASDNTVYLFFNGKPNANSQDSHVYATVSHDHGDTWSTPVDIGAGAGVVNAVFPSGVAGDPDRAACAFLGTSTAGDHQAADFKGVWYGYVAHTYDGGQSWVTVKATPNGPVQREACIWNGGGNNVCRNLLDFNDVTMDEKGRVLFGFADGCIDSCETGGTNSYASKATIARQSGGKGLLAQFDPAEPVVAQSACLSGHRDDLASYLTWIAPDTGGSPITSYKIYRSTTAPNSEIPVGQAPGNKTSFNDRTADPAVSPYIYRIVAVNGQGDGAFSNAVSLTVGPRIESLGACVLPGVLTITDPAGDETSNTPLITVGPAHDILSVSLAEIQDSPSIPTASNLYFAIQVDDLTTLPPGWRWAIRFQVNKNGTLVIPPTDQSGGASEDFFVSMVSDGQGAPTGSGNPSFTWGVTSVPQNAARIFTTKGNLDASSHYTTDGTITLVLPKSIVSNPGPGDSVVSMLGSVRLGTPSGGTNETIPDSTGAGSYTLRPTNLCLPNTAPLAVLTADVPSGIQPLTVHFNAGSSSDADTIDTIANYTFNFDDGNGDVTQSTPTITHTFNQPGEYIVRLVVTDSRGKVSSNTARFIVEVDSPLSSVVSRRAHGSAGTFDIDLPLGGTAGVECRTPGTNGSYQLVYTFARNIDGAGNATVSQGTANSAQATLGPLSNQVTVNLTGVNANAQHLVVTLNGVHDAVAGVVLNNLPARMDLLWADVNANRVLTNADVSLVKAQVAAGGAVNSSNFRNDVNANGVITNADVSVTKAQVAAGAQLP
jgi:PKD repeat protein